MANARFPLLYYIVGLTLLVLATCNTQEQQECLISPTNPCKIKSLQQGKSILVYPPIVKGGATCISGARYRFQVIRGSSTDLLIHFQGGGACWDSIAIIGGLCTTLASPVEPRGILDRGNAVNPYRNYTVLSVLYCSGDVHIGARSWSYFFDTVSVKQRGQKNFLSVWSYLQGMVKSRQLGDAKGKFKSVVLSGSSAGALGVQFWSGFLLQRLHYTKAAVIVDSLAGLFPHAALKPLLKLYGVCSYVGSLTLTSAPLASLCQRSQLTIQAVLLSTMRTFSTVPFSFLQSKEDAVQISFFDGVDLTQGLSSGVLDGPSFYIATQSFLESYNAAPNWVIYWVNGDTHEFLTQRWFFEADTMHSGASSFRRRLSSTDNSSTSAPPLMCVWISRLPLAVGKSISSQCCDVSGQVCAGSFKDKTYPSLFV